MPAPGDPQIGERQEHVVAQEPRQRHVPALPENPGGSWPKRRIKIVGNFDAEQQCQADRDVGIAGEVEKDLERKAKREEAVPSTTAGGSSLVDRVQHPPQRIAEQRFLDQPDNDEGEPRAKSLLPPGAKHRAELMTYLGPAAERAGDRLGKEAM